MKEESRYLETAYAKMWIEDGIIFHSYQSGMIITEEIAKTMVRDRIMFSKEKYIPILLDINNLNKIDSGARKYLKTPEASEYLIAGALYVNNFLTRLAGNVFLKIDRPLNPTKMFDDKNLAVQWLKKERDKFNLENGI